MTGTVQLQVGPSAALTGAFESRVAALASSIRPRVLLPTRGSGNFGETGTAAFYTIDELPHALVDMPPRALVQRTDIDLGGDRLAFYVDDVLSSSEADALAACAAAVLERNGHSRIAPGINTPAGMRVNMAAHWYPSHAAAPKFLGSLFERFRHLVPPTLGGLPLYGALSEKVAQFKYADGDRFERHVDGLFPGQGCNARGDGVDTWTGVQGGMSVLLYLNDGPSDGLVGGETRLWTADGSRFVDVTPRKGRALFFRRGSADAVLHAGRPVTGAVPKYMALVNLAYGERSGTGSGTL